MNPRFIRLPFTIPEVYQGLAEAGGLLRVDENSVTLEFEIKDSLFGVLKSRVREVQLGLRDIESVYLRKGWFRTRLYIRTYSISVLGTLPRTDKGEVELKLAKKDRETAGRLVSYLDLRLNETRIDLLDED